MAAISSAVPAVTSLFIGGAVFWAPTVVLLPPTTSENTWIITVSLLSPAALLSYCWLAIRFRKGTDGGPSSCLFALVGVWLSGPLFMMVAAALRTPQIVGDFSVLEYVYIGLLSLFPGYTLYMAAAQGSGYGIVLGTILAIIGYIALEKDRWLIPPALKRRFHLSRLSRSNSNG